MEPIEEIIIQEIKSVIPYIKDKEILKISSRIIKRFNKELKMGIKSYLGWVDLLRNDHEAIYQRWYDGMPLTQEETNYLTSLGFLV